MVTLEKLQEKHGLKINPKALELLAIGFVKMGYSTDPAHSEKHIEKLLGYYDQFLDSISTTRYQIDHEVMLLSIVWHDVWKSKKNSNSFFKFLIYQWIEGKRSKKIFERSAREINLNPTTTKQVSYSIKKHSLVQFLPRKTYEAKLLWDLDTLDMWDINRFRKFIEESFLSHKLFRKGYYYYMKYFKGSSFYYGWTQDKYVEFRSEFLVTLKAL